ncbi:ImmA/IrrE family metallo-endopeptidase [Microbacterium betulae]|uniref:ImmA/IrrE family metallo-endopeptidase n=1 Tax=Microbacterium betulae TaxID=2981139 RepID=A0AA97FHR3_9MICO|nr:ImmA/IrrE family metallo-endopeptidase [Microbacterium sp. AB]WOF23796.1 ImmA/IrrE family metallo-endopeptidase [Microbacterium sp. AB]
MDRLLSIAEDLGLRLVEARGEHAGGYRPDEKIIRVTPGLARRGARSVLAHELGHHVLGHQPSHFGPVRSRQERAANEWAARFLIDREAFAEVERLRDGHVASMAFDLDVVPELVQAFQAMLLRLGDTVYVKPRMGEGQWDHKVDVEDAR